MARVIWNRYTGGFLLCLVSLGVLYYQWEDWRSARELAAAHQKLLARAGTDDLRALLPQPVPEEQNFFALPVVKQWATRPLSQGSPFQAYDIPEHAFLPSGFHSLPFVEDADGISRVNWKAWALERSQSRKAMPEGKSIAATMDEELGDGNGLLTQLVAGLSRPASCFLPSLSDAYSAAGDDAFLVEIPKVSYFNENMLDLGLHLRAAAHAGNASKTGQMALICLRLFPEAAASHGVLVSEMIGLAGNFLAFESLQDALSCPTWSAESLRRLQLQLAKIDDLEVLNHAIILEVLWVYNLGLRMRMHPKQELDRILPFDPPRENWSMGMFRRPVRNALNLIPRGWVDANIACHLEAMLEFMGADDESSWRSAGQRYREVKNRLHPESGTSYNPRRILSGFMFPALGDIYRAAAQSLFRRRCLIVACALERHRMEHGTYPASLQAVQMELKSFKVTDPAPQGAPLGYRLDPSGYTLWSAGPDGIDDGGNPEKDWLWRMRPAKD